MKYLFLLLCTFLTTGIFAQETDIIAAEPMPRPVPSTRMDSVLILLDGEIYGGKMEDIRPESIESINVIKDRAVLAERYPNKPINGIIEIRSKGANDATSTEAPAAEVFRVVDSMPVYLCEDGSLPPADQQHQCLIAWVSENLVYPEQMKKRGRGGKVAVQFVVTKTGSVDQIEIIRSPNAKFSQAALDMMKKMGPWQPGMIEGEPVNVRFVLPVNFALD